MVVGSKIYQKEKCYNVLDWAKEEINTAPDGSVFLADVHEYTHGRQGRAWKNYPEQLKITVLFKPELLKTTEKNYIPLRLNQLNMAMTMAIHKSLQEYNIGLKWPNDFMLNNKKVGGIIMELVWQNGRPIGIVMALAINVNNTILPSDQIYDIAISLKDYTNKTVDKQALQDSLIKNIDTFYQKWINQEFDQLYNLWKNAQSYLGKKISIHQKDGAKIKGYFENVLSNGDLVLKTSGDKKIIPFYIVEEVSTT